MKNLSTDDKDFVYMIGTVVPSMGRVEFVQKVMEKYTWGYLRKPVFELALGANSAPRIQLGDTGGTAAGSHGNGLITINTEHFKGFKRQESTYLRSMPITVLHELAHWGCWKHLSDGKGMISPEGYEHHFHGDYKSPLTKELEDYFNIPAFIERLIERYF
ncbi:hypothetical protein [Roseibium sp.]|uniref:hypothetical protein n=1 Tax=Roseibium sp. TaxID=1936156 RepID=UPI003B504803